jgi:hypothetical protein
MQKAISLRKTGEILQESKDTGHFKILLFFIIDGVGLSP